MEAPDWKMDGQRSTKGDAFLTGSRKSRRSSRLCDLATIQCSSGLILSAVMRPFSILRNRALALASALGLRWMVPIGTGFGCNPDVSSLNARSAR